MSTRCASRRSPRCGAVPTADSRRSRRRAVASRAWRSASGTDRPEEAEPAIGTPEEILRALADPTRLSVAGQLARGPQTASAVAKATGLRTDVVRRHLSRLARVGIVSVES